MRKTVLLTLILIGTLSFQSSGQGVHYTIDLNNATSISQNLNALSVAETAFWVNAFQLDSAMTARLKNNNYSLYMQYVNIMKTFNYKMEKVLLTERYNFKVRRRRFMKTFLSDKDFKTYEGIVANSAKKEIKRYKTEATQEIRQMRVQAAGWNVLGHTINFK